MSTTTTAIPKQESPRKKQKMETHVEIVDLGDDDDDGFLFAPPISNQGTNKKDPISVERYSEDRELHLAIMISLKETTFIDLENQDNNFDDDDDDLKVLTVKPQRTPFGKRKKPFSGPSVTETGQSSNPKNDNDNNKKDKEEDNPSFVCEICVEPKSSIECFSIMGCSHAYCTDCMAKYVESKLQENILCIRCPVAGCTGLLEPEYCRPILPKEVFDRWGNAMCEAVILGSQKFYCPFKDCSLLLIDDGEEVITESECPNCRRMFCAQCKVAWHVGIECEEFQKLNKDEREKEDIMLMNLAQSKQWKRCPRCRFFVERSAGCLYMRCRDPCILYCSKGPMNEYYMDICRGYVCRRCGIAFCYGCGSISVSNSHFCQKCRR